MWQDHPLRNMWQDDVIVVSRPTLNFKLIEESLFIAFSILVLNPIYHVEPVQAQSSVQQ